MAFSQYYRVRGSATGQASDIDLLVALADWSLLPEILEVLARLPFVSPDTPADIANRYADYTRLVAIRGQGIYSQKFRLWEARSDPDFPLSCDQSYSLSIHFLSFNFLEELLLTDLFPKQDFRLRAFSYRDRPAQGRTYRRENLAVAFSGEVVSDERTDKAWGRGFLEQFMVWEIRANRFYAGRLLCSILPTATLAWGNDEVYRLTLAFIGRIESRLRYEQKVRPNERQSVALAHIRSSEFVPYAALVADQA